MPEDRSLVRRMKGAAALDVAVYREVRLDGGATVQALTVVALAALAQAVGASATGLLGTTGAAVNGFVGWVVFLGLAYLLAEALFRGRATWDEVLRPVGFAQAPGVLAVFAFFPLVGWLVDTVVVVWILWASILAIRESTGIGAGQAAVTGVVAGALWAVFSLTF